jgi:RNA methyltransferase, TrmH family
MEQIISPSNPRIKALAKLLERKEREQTGLFLIEGVREVRRGLEAGLDFREVFFAQNLNDDALELIEFLASLDPIALTQLSDPLLRKLSSRENPANVIGVARIPQRPLFNFVPPSNALVLVLVGLEKPGNLGAILRSADAAGADTVLVVGGVDLYNSQVIRNSTGVVFSLPIFAVREEEARAWLKQYQIPLLATTPHTPHTYWDVDMRNAVAVLLGTEHEGLGAEWLEAAQHRVKIPMQGQADSLNVSVTAALMLFEALRQRQG